MYVGIQKQIDELTGKDADGSYINPSSRVLLNVQLLKSYLGSGRVLEAQANLEGALRAYGVVKGMAGDLIKQGQTNEVWPYLKMSYLMIGTVLWKQSNRGQTLEECREWVAFVKDHTADIKNSQSELITALWTLAWYYIKNGKFAEAQATAMEARALDDGNKWILVLLSITEMYRGNMRVATDMHLQHRNEMVTLPGGKQKKWPELVGEYFGELKKDGLERAEMVNIEHMLAKKE